MSRICFPLVVALGQMAASAAAEPLNSNLTVILVLDSDRDGVDGAEFCRTLEAYVGEAGATVMQAVIDKLPQTHDDWIALAKRRGAARGAVAVLWIEPMADSTDLLNVYLVLLERQSQAVVVMPVELGLRRGATVLRVLAATTRAILDADVLGDLRKAADVAAARTTPAPWPAPSRSEAAPSGISRTVTLRAGYALDLRLSEPYTLHGVRLGAALGLSSWLGGAIDFGYSTRAPVSAAGLRIREHRAPWRVGPQGTWAIGRSKGALFAFWVLEPIWLTARAFAEEIEVANTVTRFDTGGGAELSWRWPVSGLFGLFVAASASFMAVSHHFVSGDQLLQDNSFVKFGFGAGIDVTGL